jgi:hypothetical protein
VRRSHATQARGGATPPIRPRDQPAAVTRKAQQTLFRAVLEVEAGQGQDQPQAPAARALPDATHVAGGADVDAMDIDDADDVEEQQEGGDVGEDAEDDADGELAPLARGHFGAL